MANKVFANNNEVSCKAASGMTIAALPDTCFTPPENPATPPGVPLPYPNTGKASDTTKGSKTVKISKKEVGLKNKSYFKTSYGDEAGCAAKKGVITSTNKGKVYFQAWSSDVKFEGENAVRHLDITTNNHASGPGDTPPWPYLDRMAMAMAKECDEMRQQISNDEGTGACDPWEEKAVCPANTAVKKSKEHRGTAKSGGGDRSPLHEAAKEAVVLTFEQFADQVDDNECQKKLRCVFVPYKKSGSTPPCCPNQTPHHVIEASSFLAAGTRDSGGTPIPGWDNYDADSAPCVCVEGENQTMSTHGQMHLRQGVCSANMQDANGNWTRQQATDVGAKAVAKTFPDSECDEDCLKAQLDAYHDQAKSEDPEKPIRAISTMSSEGREAAAASMDVPWPRPSTR